MTSSFVRASQAFVGLVALGVLDDSMFRNGVSWGLVVYLGVDFGIGDILHVHKLDQWVGTLNPSASSEIVANPYLFVLAVGLAGIALNFVVNVVTASVLIAVVAIPLAAAASINPFVAVIAIQLVGGHRLASYTSTMYSAFYAAGNGQLFSHDQARLLGLLQSLFALGALLASVPYWDLIGLL